MEVCEQLIQVIYSFGRLSEPVKLYAFSPEKETLAEEFTEVADKIDPIPFPDAIYNAFRATIRTLKLDKNTIEAKQQVNMTRCKRRGKHYSINFKTNPTMYILKHFQETAVKALLNHTYEALHETGEQIPILLEAPTGSGKTVMMASYLERLSEELPLHPGLQHITLLLSGLRPIRCIYKVLSRCKSSMPISKLNCIDLGRPK